MLFIHSRKELYLAHLNPYSLAVVTLHSLITTEPSVSTPSINATCLTFPEAFVIDTIDFGIGLFISLYVRSLITDPSLLEEDMGHQDNSPANTFLTHN